MKHFVIVIPRAEIEMFEQAVTDTLEDSKTERTPAGLAKYSVKVYYPEWTNPHKFVDLGTRFNELLQAETEK